MWLMWGKNSTSESLTTLKETHKLEKLKNNQGIAKGVQKMRNDIIAINVKNNFYMIEAWINSLQSVSNTIQVRLKFDETHNSSFRKQKLEKIFNPINVKNYINLIIPLYKIKIRKCNQCRK